MRAEPAATGVRVGPPRQHLGIGGGEHGYLERDRRERELGVRVRRSGDRDCVDPVERECGRDVGQRARHAEQARPFPRAVGITADDRFHVEAGSSQRAHMRDATEPGSQDDCADVGLGHVPRGVMPAAM